jgi:hypothetical protein
MSLVLTRIQNIRAKANLDKWETRPSRYGVYDLFKRDTENPMGIITPELKQKAFASIGSTLETPVIDYDGTVTIGSSRTATIADDENTSKMQSITFTTYAFGFTQVPSLFHNNEIGLERDFEAKFLKYLYKLGATLDTAGATALTTNKTQIYAETLDFTNTANVITSSAANQEKIFGALNTMMWANDFDGDTLNVVVNPGFQYIISQMEEKAKYNSQDKTIQFIGKNMGYSNRITNAVADKATGFAVVPGSVGMLTRLEREALMNIKSKTGHEWEQTTLPMLDLPCAVYTYESVGDYNAIAGAASADMTRAHKVHYGFAVDVAFVAPYNSDLTSYASPIIKFATTTA